MIVTIKRPVYVNKKDNRIIDGPGIEQEFEIDFLPRETEIIFIEDREYTVDLIKHFPAENKIYIWIS